MIDLHVDVELKDTLIVAMFNIDSNGHIIHSIHVEYEWEPIRSSSCKVFGHSLDQCPKKIVYGVNMKTQRQFGKGLQWSKILVTLQT